MSGIRSLRAFSRASAAITLIRHPAGGTATVLGRSPREEAPRGTLGDRRARAVVVSRGVASLLARTPGMFAAGEWSRLLTGLCSIAMLPAFGVSVKLSGDMWPGAERIEDNVGCSIGGSVPQGRGHHRFTQGVGRRITSWRRSRGAPCRAVSVYGPPRQCILGAVPDGLLRVRRTFVESACASVVRVGSEGDKATNYCTTQIGLRSGNLRKFCSNQAQPRLGATGIKVLRVVWVGVGVRVGVRVGVGWFDTRGSVP